jgi:hypothetical protein
MCWPALTGVITAFRHRTVFNGRCSPVDVAVASDGRWKALKSPALLVLRFRRRLSPKHRSNIIAVSVENITIGETIANVLNQLPPIVIGHNRNAVFLGRPRLEA